MVKNKREHKRTESSYPVRYRQKESKKIYNSIARDISDTGIGFTAKEFLPVSTHIVIETRHPESRKFIETLARVIWVSEKPHSDTFFTGASFVGKAVTL